MGSGGSSGFNFGTMMNNSGWGGWPTLLIGLLVVAGIAALVIWAMRASKPR